LIRWEPIKIEDGARGREDVAAVKPSTVNKNTLRKKMQKLKGHLHSREHEVRRIHVPPQPMSNEDSKHIIYVTMYKMDGITADF
jgi:hypothetical protein